MGAFVGRPVAVAANPYRSGLGNRIRLTLAVKALAEWAERDFSYVWPTGPLFGPRLDELWDVHDATLGRYTQLAMSKVIPFHGSDVTHIASDQRRVWLIRSGAPLELPEGVEDWRVGFRSLTPAAEIAERITSFFDTELRGAPYVGVNVRAHAVSHQVTKDASPVEWFVDRLQALRAENADLRYFLSCDDPDAQRHILATVPGGVALEDKGGYNTSEGVRSSIVDLYLLASAGYLVGPHWSSFIHMSEFLAADKLTLETSVQSGPEHVDPAAVGIVTDPLRPALREVVSSR